MGLFRSPVTRCRQVALYSQSRMIFLVEPMDTTRPSECKR